MTSFGKCGEVTWPTSYVGRNVFYTTWKCAHSGHIYLMNNSLSMLTKDFLMESGIELCCCDSLHLVWIKLILFLERQNQSWFQVDHTNLHTNRGCFLQVFFIHCSNLAANIETGSNQPLFWFQQNLLHVKADYSRPCSSCKQYILHQELFCPKSTLKYVF